MILQHALQWPIMMVKFITMSRICVIKLRFVIISCQRRFFIFTNMTMAFIKFLSMYIVKTLVLLIPHEIRLYDVSFGRKTWQTSVFGQNMEISILSKQKVENLNFGAKMWKTWILVQKSEKHRFRVKSGKNDFGSNMWKTSILGQKCRKHQFCVKNTRRHRCCLKKWKI